MFAVLTFFTLTFVLSWSAWFAAAALAGGHAAPRALGALSLVRGSLFLLGTFAPAIIALILSWRGWGAGSDGRQESGALDLLRRIGRWRVGARWYVFALLYMAVIKLLVALILRVATGAWPPFGETRPLFLLAAVVFSAWAQAGEELGWRGFALPRLTSKFGLVGASLLLGIVWALWHLPLFFLPAGDTYGQSFPLFLAELVAMSVTLAWLYWRTGGSVLLVMILHSAINNTKDIVPSVVPGATNPFALSPSRSAWLTVALLWVSAAVLAWQMRGACLITHDPTSLRTRPGSALRGHSSHSLNP